ncbi:Protein of unknown function [Lachnospiraceae bacterium]|nr:Protein of unknown function [Lachnospiraceae bacterium]
MKKLRSLFTVFLCTTLVSGLLLTSNLSERAYGAVVRNTTFTSASDMKSKLGTTDAGMWNPSYLTEVENTYWSFAPSNMIGKTEITLDMAKNNYRNLEMLLDNGYTMSYSTLSDYCDEYLAKKNGEPDSFYNILHSCLGNPYLTGRPAASVTATTYNGRDYSKVFDATYYLAAHPELAGSVGNNPAELLRYFVETGIAQGHSGNASFNVATYAAGIDASVLNNQLASSSYKALGNGKPAPTGKYSYSWANYYGKYLGHYTAGALTQSSTAPAASASAKTPTESDDIDSLMLDGAEDNSAAVPKTVTGTYKETSTKSVYTNEAVTSAQANQRPLAVMMPTDKAAQPSYGISRADILYEIMEEGGISRQMAIIPNWTDLSRIGNLRSCRLYYISAAKEWDPILIHFGGVAYMKGVINAPDVNNISGTYEYGVGGKAPGAGNFFRSSDRTAPHNAYISASGIQKACMQQGYLTNLRAGYYNSKHFTFADGVNDLSGAPGVQNATNIDLSDIFPYSKSKFTYNASQGVYYKSIHGGAQTDAINGKQISFANVIVQNTKWKQLDKKGYLGFTMVDTTEDGYYFTKGKCIHITWKKTGDYVPTKYYDDAGNEIKLNTGKTYIGIAQKGRSPKFN